METTVKSWETYLGICFSCYISKVIKSSPQMDVRSRQMIHVQIWTKNLVTKFDPKNLFIRVRKPKELLSIW